MSRHSANKREVVLHAAATLGIGDTTRDVLCPVCGGGQGNEKSFAITREQGKVLYYCHRATCGLAGSYLAKGIPPQTGTPRRREYTGAICQLPSEYHTLLTQRYGLTGDELARNRVGWSPSMGRVLYPILDPYGAQLGLVARSYSGVKPKSLEFWESDRLRVHFPDQNHPAKERVVCVEDTVSSIRVARHSPCVALLGTNLEIKSAVFLSRRFRELHVMLDPGAEHKAFQIAKNIGTLFRKVTVSPKLKNDPKDMNDEELKEALS